MTAADHANTARNTMSAKISFTQRYTRNGKRLPDIQRVLRFHLAVAKPWRGGYHCCECGRPIRYGDRRWTDGDHIFNICLGCRNTTCDEVVA